MQDAKLLSEQVQANWGAGRKPNAKFYSQFIRRLVKQNIVIILKCCIRSAIFLIYLADCISCIF